MNLDPRKNRVRDAALCRMSIRMHMEFLILMKIMFGWLLRRVTSRTPFISPPLAGPLTGPFMGVIPRPHWRMRICARLISSRWAPRRMAPGKAHQEEWRMMDEYANFYSPMVGLDFVVSRPQKRPLGGALGAAC